MWLNFCPICGNNSLSYCVGGTCHLIFSLMLGLDLLVLLVFSLFSLLSVLLIKTELRLTLGHLSDFRLSVMVAHIHFLLKVLLYIHLLVVLVWRDFSKWWGSVPMWLSVLKSVVLNSSVLIAFVGLHVLLTVSLVVVFNTFFSLSLLGIAWFPRGSSYRCWLMPVILSLMI